MFKFLNETLENVNLKSLLSSRYLSLNLLSCYLSSLPSNLLNCIQSSLFGCLLNHLPQGILIYLLNHRHPLYLITHALICTGVTEVFFLTDRLQFFFCKSTFLISGAKINNANSTGAEIVFFCFIHYLYKSDAKHTLSFFQCSWTCHTY